MPEAELWQEVLRLAVDDALLGPINVPNRTSYLVECEKARNFLTTPSDHLATVCHLAGVDPRAVLERMRARIATAPTPQELLDQPTQRRDAATKAPAKPKAIPFKDRSYTINGTTRTAAEWCERTGIGIEAAARRISSGWTPERAFFATKKEVARERTGQTRRKRAPSATALRYEHNGESLTLAEWSERTGVKKGTLYKRIVLSGWSVGEALTNRDTRHNRFARVI
ncbi:MAG: hypothetical protein ACK46Q_05025 [Hyphomonas sp.]